MESRREETEARPVAEGAPQRARGRLTVRGVLEILAERPSDELRAESAQAADEDLRAVLAFESGELLARGVVQ